MLYVDIYDKTKNHIAGPYLMVHFCRIYNWIIFFKGV